MYYSIVATKVIMGPVIIKTFDVMKKKTMWHCHFGTWTLNTEFKVEFLQQFHFLKVNTSSLIRKSGRFRQLKVKVDAPNLSFASFLFYIFICFR